MYHVFYPQMLGDR